MNYFFDTSSLWKRYHYESGTRLVDEIFSEKENRIFICSFVISEITGTLAKLYRKEIISIEDVNYFLSQLGSDLFSAKIGIIDVWRTMIFHSQQLILKHFISATDAIILSAALSVKSEKIVFVSADEQLLKIAKSENLKTLETL
jgi:predicted nucleic acid-binding protein